jgi:tetratricopeptide (TPR) repeat protein
MARENHSARLENEFVPSSPQTGVIAAMRHALAAGGRVLAAILVFSIVVRIVHLAEFVATNPLATELYSDAKLYHDWAVAIANGALGGTPEPFHHPPAYPYLVALVYAIVGAHPLAVWILQSACGPMVLLCIYTVARRLAPQAAALAVTAAATLYHPLMLFETRLLAESVTTLVCAIAMVQLSGAAGPLSRGRLFAAGITLGIAAALRPNQMLAIALIGLTIPLAGTAPRRWMTRWIGGGVLLLGAALAIAPFTIRNLAVAGEFVLLCDTGGVNLFLAHHPAAGASFRVPDPEWGNVEDQPRVARRYATALAGTRDLSWAEVSATLGKRAVRFALSQPAIELRLLAARARACLDSFEYEVLYSPAAERAIQRSAIALPVSFAPFAIFVLAGALALLRCKTLRRDPAAIACLAFTVAQWLTVLLFFQYSRFRVVSLVAIAPLAAVGLATVAAQLRSRKPRGETLLALASLCVTVLPRTSEALEQVANQHVTIGASFRARGEFADARAALDRARDLAPDSQRLVLERHRLAIAESDLAAARTILETALARRPDQPVLLVELSRFHAVVSNPPDFAAARDAAVRAIEAAPAFVPAHEALGLAQIGLGDDEALRAAMQRATALPGASSRLFAMYGRALRLAGDFAAARAALEHALQLDPDSEQARSELRLLR